jgi:hypothetical protein
LVLSLVEGGLSLKFKPPTIPPSSVSGRRLPMSSSAGDPSRSRAHLVGTGSPQGGHLGRLSGVTERQILMSGGESVGIRFALPSRREGGLSLCSIALTIPPASVSGKHMSSSAGDPSRSGAQTSWALGLSKAGIWADGQGPRGGGS